MTVEVAEEDVDELNRWYEEEHRPEKLSLPGYTGLRRFRASDGAPKFLAIYELEHPTAASGRRVRGRGRGRGRCDQANGGDNDDLEAMGPQRVGGIGITTHLTEPGAPSSRGAFPPGARPADFGGCTA
jgi:hypothetical protein